MTRTRCEHCCRNPARLGRRLCHGCMRVGVREAALPQRSPNIVRLEGWRTDAACADLDPNLWHPDQNTIDGRRAADQARRICQACPVCQACLDEALRNREPEGIWGGLDPSQRDSERRRRGKARRQALQLVHTLAHQETA